MNKCESLARFYVWWPNIYLDIEKICNNYDICNQLRDNSEKNILRPWPVTPKLGLDYIRTFWVLFIKKNLGFSHQMGQNIFNEKHHWGEYN